MDNSPSNRPLLALLTDFGLRDPYAAQLKGKVMKYCPQAAIIDISHEIPPFNVRAGAYFLAATAGHFPLHTMFLAVVDPEVGSSRDLVALETGGQTFIGPNNGLFCLIELEGPARLWRLRGMQTRLDSAVFAGRDIMAPAAGMMLAGTPLEEMADPMDLAELVRGQWGYAKPGRGAIEAEVLYIDHFGNMILNLTRGQWESLKPQGPIFLQIGNKELPLLNAEHYAQIPDNAPALIPGSQGYMEIAMNRNQACRMLGVPLDSTAATTVSIIW